MMTMGSSEQGHELFSRIWDLREEGVWIRDAGYKFDTKVEEWTPLCLDWEKRFVEAVREVNPDLARRIKPLAGLDPTDPREWEASVAVGGIRHAKNVAAMTTIMRLVALKITGV
jgi:hypothetical protein